jgi:hypothetical protein
LGQAGQPHKIPLNHPVGVGAKHSANNLQG